MNKEIITSLLLITFLLFFNGCTELTNFSDQAVNDVSFSITDYDVTYHYDTIFEDYKMNFNFWAYHPDGKEIFLSLIIDFGDGSRKEVITNKNTSWIMHRFPGEGSYTVNVTMRDINSNEDYFEEEISIVENEIPIANPSIHPLSGSNPLNVTFENMNSYDPDPLDRISLCIWNVRVPEIYNEENVVFLEEKRVEFNESFFVVYDQPGSYPVSLTVYDSRGGKSNMITETIRVFE
jgi:PKD repeat protein